MCLLSYAAKLFLRPAAFAFIVIGLRNNHGAGLGTSLAIGGHRLLTNLLMTRNILLAAFAGVLSTQRTADRT